MAAASNGNSVQDTIVDFKVHGKSLPTLNKEESYKYLGCHENTNENPSDMTSHMHDKIERNIKLIDSVALLPWDRIKLASWLIMSVLTFYLTNGRVEINTLRHWSKMSHQAMKRWLGMSSLYNSSIHLPNDMRGMRIPDFEDINKERKITMFFQFLYSNNAQLQDSTVNNLLLELGRRRIVLNRGDVLRSTMLGDTVHVRDYTLLWNVEPCINNVGLKLVLTEANHSQCFCAFPPSFESNFFLCNQCNNQVHTYCDPERLQTSTCAVCIRRLHYAPRTIPAFSYPYYQSNWYSWDNQIVPVPTLHGKPSLAQNAKAWLTMYSDMATESGELMPHT